jgi:hypothetical protein
MGQARPQQTNGAKTSGRIVGPFLPAAAAAIPVVHWRTFAVGFEVAGSRKPRLYFPYDGMAG